jgi:hypothetical protein
MTTSGAPARLSRDRLAVLAGLVAPVALAAILVPFRSSIPNTDAALAASRRAGYLDGINSIAQAVAAGGSASALIEQVTTLEQRLLAVALADQVGAALATSHPVDQS